MKCPYTQKLFLPEADSRDSCFSTFSTDSEEQYETATATRVGDVDNNRNKVKINSRKAISNTTRIGSKRPLDQDTSTVPTARVSPAIRRLTRKQKIGDVFKRIFVICRRHG